MNTLHPELIGEYEQRPGFPGSAVTYWRCLACEADARKRSAGKRGTDAHVTDRAKHTKWHNRGR